MYKILTALDPILRKVSTEVDLVDSNIQSILDKMLNTMYHDKGVGLAAPQVGISKRLFVLDLGDNDPIQRDEGFYPLFVVNPQIIEKSEDIVEGIEGCLSVPGVTIKIKRPEHIKVLYIDYNNKKQILEAQDWLARAFLHELDHLNGVLAIDYLSPVSKAVALDKMKRFINKNRAAQ
jgi:peptide deformylase